MNVPVLDSEQRYYCPNCPVEEINTGPRLTLGQEAGLFHACAGLNGITAPLVLAGIRCKVAAREREDYIGSELVTYDADRRPIMSVVTTRDDGEDAAVFAPCINVNMRSIA